MKSIIPFFAKQWLISGVLSIGIFSALAASHYFAFMKGKEIESARHQSEMIQLIQNHVEILANLRKMDVDILTDAYHEDRRIRDVLSTINTKVETPECENLGEAWLIEFNRAITSQ
jgi:predicted HAD superfamily hydrolase